MSKINENFFKNRKYEGKIIYFEKEINKKESNNELIKNTLGQTECEITKLQAIFYSDENIKIINNLLRKKIYYASDKKYNLMDQNKQSLLIIMRWIWSMYSRNLDFKIKEQINNLNCKVVDEILPQVLSNIEQYFQYLKDYEKAEESKFEVNLLPVSTKVTRGTTELPAMSETLF